MKCEKCGKEIFLPFRCPYCGGYFCSEHRLPENHDCPRMELARAPREGPKPIIAQKQKPYECTFSGAPLRLPRRINFSNKEVKHLAVAVLLVMAIGLSLYRAIELSHLALFTTILIASFFIHEMAHKIVAQKHGYSAEFRLIFTGAILTLISIALPPQFFKIISPGAVMVTGFVDREDIGRISIAGPMTNIILSTVFISVALFLPQHTLISMVFAFGAIFNAWIAFFNLIPLGMLDGFKVFVWKKVVWALTFAASLALTILSYSYFFF